MMAYFRTKNPELGWFWRALQWKMLVYYLAIWSIYGYLVYCVAILYIVWPFGLFFCYLVYCVAIWYIVWPFGKLNGYLVYFSRFGMYVAPRKIWQLWSRVEKWDTPSRKVVKIWERPMTRCLYMYVIRIWAAGAKFWILANFQFRVIAMSEYPPDGFDNNSTRFTDLLSKDMR
jgi:hypothetical protein